MKSKNELQKAINLAFTQIINIVDSLGESFACDVKKDGRIWFKKLHVESIDKANDAAKEMHGLYAFNFFNKEGLVMVKIVSNNGLYYVPANTGSLICLKKECSKAWGQLNIETKQPVKIEIKPKKEIFRPKMKVITVKKKEPTKKATIIRNLEPKKYNKDYYLYNGERYYFINKFIYTRWQKKQS
jgi:hypothetical protein